MLAAAAVGLRFADAALDVHAASEVSGHSSPPATPKWTYIDEFGRELPKVRDQNGCYMQPGRTYVEIPLPPPIRRFDLNRWAEILTLSEAQRLQLDRLYEEYSVRELEYHDAHVQALWDEASDLVSEDPVWEDLDRLQALARIEDVRCPQARRRLESIEMRLFDELAPLLSDEQAEELDTVRRLRRRQSYRLPPLYPGADLDLIEFLSSIERREESGLQPNDPEAFRERLYSYDLTLTSLVVRRGVQRPRLTTEVTRADAERIAIRRGGGDESEMSAASQKVRSCRRRILNLEKPIFQLNQEYVTLLGELLPEETADKLESFFTAAVYPTVYPDYTNAMPVLEQVNQSEDLSSQVQSRIQAIVAWYEPARMNICDQMARRYLKWSEEFALEMGYDRQDFIRFDRDMRGLHKQRADLALMAIEQLREALTDEQWEELTEWRDWFQGQLDREYNPDPRIRM